MFWYWMPWVLLLLTLWVMRAVIRDNRRLRQDNQMLRKIAEDAEGALERLAEFGDMTITTDADLALKLGLDKKSPLP